MANARLRIERIGKAIVNAMAFFYSGVIKVGACGLLLVLISCGDTGSSEILIYDGPLREAENVEHYYAENGIIKVRMVAEQMFELQNGDRQFPKGIYLEFFDEVGKIESTLRANQAFFIKEEEVWRGVGNVEVINTQKREQLNTEELFWKPKDKRIYTDKFVTIRMQSDVIYGEGLEAAQDMSSYRILKPSGTLEVKE
ncbi:MAG: LPS export ABC transporter periplasmic protein LptC [Cyclobacteriaceae bacterium]|nr:LPS export ABC transporter periplasmic protein LptC [Cyclobacteriaceae bacterium]